MEPTKEALWLRTLMEDFRFPQVLPTIIKCNNQSSIALTQNPKLHARTMHFEIQHHFIRDIIQNEKVTIEHCHTSINVADAFTKSLTKEKHQARSYQLDVLEDEMVKEYFIKIGHLNHQNSLWFFTKLCSF
jgi:CRISPR/Cas system-associated endonuclease Cas1